LQGAPAALLLAPLLHKFNFSAIPVFRPRKKQSECVMELGATTEPQIRRVQDLRSKNHVPFRCWFFFLRGQSRTLGFRRDDFANRRFGAPLSAARNYAPHRRPLLMPRLLTSNQLPSPNMPPICRQLAGTRKFQQEQALLRQELAAEAAGDGHSAPSSPCHHNPSPSPTNARSRMPSPPPVRTSNPEQRSTSPTTATSPTSKQRKLDEEEVDDDVFSSMRQQFTAILNEKHAEAQRRQALFYKMEVEFRALQRQFRTTQFQLVFLIISLLFCFHLLSMIV